MIETMSYHKRTQATILVGAALLVIFALGQRFAPLSVTWLATGIILLIGFPHGADDLEVLRKLGLIERRLRIQGLVAYVAAIFLTLVLWYVSSAAGLIFFILLSILHFGQDHVEHLGLRGKMSNMYALSWGIYVLLAPLSWRAAEVQPVVEAMLGMSIPPLLLTVIAVLSAVSGGITLLLAGYRFSQGGDRMWLAEIVLLLLLCHVYLLFPSLWGFAFFFVAVHATTSIVNQIDWDESSSDRNRLFQFLWRGAPYALVAVIGIPLVLISSHGTELDANWLAGFFVLISAFTTPHAVVMHVALRQLRNQSSQRNPRLRPNTFNYV